MASFGAYWPDSRLSRLSVRWTVVALVLPLAMMAAAIAVSVAVFGAPRPAVTFSVAGVVLAEFVRVLFLGGPVEEELGWRGFALPRLQQHRNALDASILLGLIWGFWHLPLYFVLGTGQSEMLRAGTSPAFAIGGFSAGRSVSRCCSPGCSTKPGAASSW